MFMKLINIYEARYRSHERGTLEWILDKFFVGPNKDNEYWLDEDRVIAIFDGEQIIGLQLIRRERNNQKPELFIKWFTEHSGREGKSRYTSSVDAVKSLHIYSSKRLV